MNEKPINKVGFLDCKFDEKLQKCSHYIDSKLNNKKSSNVRSCYFENDESEAINAEMMNDKIHMKAYLSHISNYTMHIIAGIVILIALIAFIFFNLNVSQKNIQ